MTCLVVHDAVVCAHPRVDDGADAAANVLASVERMSTRRRARARDAWDFVPVTTRAGTGSRERARAMPTRAEARARARGVVSSIRARGGAVMDRGARESAARVGMTLELGVGARARVTRRRRWTTSAARGDAAGGDAGECEG